MRIIKLTAAGLLIALTCATATSAQSGDTFLSERHTRYLVRQAILLNAGEDPVNLKTNCEKIDYSTVRCYPTWVDLYDIWSARFAANNDGGHIVWLMIGHHVPRSCLKKKHRIDRCAQHFRWTSET